MNRKQTSNSVSSLAPQVLRNPQSFNIQKKLAGSWINTSTNKH